MINLLAILLSTGMVMWVVIRAAKLNRTRCWFETRSLYEQEQRRERDVPEAPKGQDSPGPRWFSLDGRRARPPRGEPHADE